MKANLYDSNKELKNKILRRFSMFDNAGLDLTQCTTYDEALEAAGLDYHAKKTPIFLEGGIAIPDRYAVVTDEDPNTALGIVGKSYQPMNNREAFELIEEIVDEGKMSYEAGGITIGHKDLLDRSKAFIVCRGEPFYIHDEPYNQFLIARNDFTGLGGVTYMTIAEREWCLNGAVRYLGGKKSQLQISIQHSRNTQDKLQKTKFLINQQLEVIEDIKKEAELFAGVHMTREEFEKKIIPIVLEKRGLVEKEKERQRGQERLERTVGELLQAYNADDTQNYNNTAYKAILALSDYETHSSPLRETGNGQMYLNRIMKGMVLTTAVAQYIAQAHNLKVNY